jgi:hypothetical protein
MQSGRYGLNSNAAVDCKRNATRSDIFRRDGWRCCAQSEATPTDCDRCHCALKSARGAGPDQGGGCTSSGLISSWWTVGFRSTDSS